MFKRTAIGLIAATLILTGCGGGDSSSSPSYSGPTGAVTVTSTTEANTVAGFAASQALSSSMSSLSGTYTPFTANDGMLNLQSLGTLAQKYANMAFKVDISGTTLLPTGVSSSQTQACTTSGNITVTYEAASAATYPSSGDSVTFAFNSCVESNIMLSGSMKLTVNTYTSGSAFSATYTFNQLKTTLISTGDYSMIHGDYTASISDSSTLFEASLTGTSLYFEASISGTTGQALLSNFSYVDTYTYASGDWSMDHDFTFASTDLGGSVNVNTVTPFVVPAANTYPTSGQMVVTGAGGAKIRLTAQPDGTNVYVEYDIVPVDGVYESNTTVAWSSL